MGSQETGSATGLLPSATSLTLILLRETGHAHAPTCPDHGLEGSSLRLTINSLYPCGFPWKKIQVYFLMIQGLPPSVAFPVCSGRPAVRTGLGVARTVGSSGLPEGRCSGEAGGALQGGPRSTFSAVGNADYTLS